VLLGDRGERVESGGITWQSVSTPTGQPGWASADYLETGKATTPASAHPKATRTGNAAVDVVLAAIESGDPAKVTGLVKFTSIPCRTVSGIGVEPFCPEGVAVGTPLEVFPTACAEGTSIVKDAFTAQFLPGIESNPFAVIRSHGFWSGAEGYAILYRTPYPWGAQLYLDDGGHITSFVSCGPKSEDVLASTPASDILLGAPK
jgi:hypothetical protein